MSYFLVASVFFAAAWVLGRDNAGPLVVAMAIGAIAFLTMAIVSALAASRSPRQPPEGATSG
ncbi:hypothetical protein [Jannaschia sp. R86511]|uniref:hypothetical protein n=1 Tax=Jannaschia sp. R86511 TaxID=3093853 RepID=UPI0036D41947